MLLAMAKTRNYRGYLTMKTLGNDPEFKGNVHESFHVWQEHEPDDPDVLAGKPLHDRNQWPSQMPELRQEVLTYVGEVTDLARNMLKVVALGIDLPEDTFLKFFDTPISLLRFIHYPPQDASDMDGRYGVRPHTDNGVFTLLAQDDTGGLGILGADGAWMSAPPVRNSYVVNLGEMMKVWTNGLFLATPHRVINRYGKERYSIPFFLNPRYDALIEPILIHKGDKIEPVFHTTVSREEPSICGDILTRLYRRIWPSLDALQVK